MNSEGNDLRREASDMESAIDAEQSGPVEGQ
jgi:hypothetical protein